MCGNSLAGATIMSIGYDIEVQPQNDPYVQTAEEAVASIAETTNAGSYLVDVIPIRECPYCMHRSYHSPRSSLQ